MPEGKKIEIKPAKGRPMLTWVGKRPLSYVTAFPAQHVETFAPSHSEQDYSKAVGDPKGKLELMLFFVESGTSFTLELGDIDENLYISLERMYTRPSTTGFPGVFTSTSTSFMDICTITS